MGNLLSNASLYSPEGAEIRVWCGRLEGRPALTVENTGAHIGEEALPHLFEAFYREEGSRNRSTGGSGLGLYLVKMILDRHGAVCTIENTEDGVRATVRFQFSAHVRTFFRRCDRFKYTLRHRTSGRSCIDQAKEVAYGEKNPGSWFWTQGGKLER